MLREYHLGEQPIPPGFQIYEDRLEVAGVGYRREDGASFARHRNTWLEFRSEPTNSHDPNAIMIFGCWKGWFFVNRCHIGYVPKEVSQSIANARLNTAVRPRLLKTYVGDGGYVEILFQVIGPKDRIDEYRKA